MNQQNAQGLASFGRGPDSMLVHMAPGEVRSLQQLAMAHGGSLTINPQTGLPEAGFLSSLLPMLIGAGLTAATGGMAAPLIAGMSNAATIGLGIGGFEALRTGSLKKGLMAGLGAYGGAGLGSALAGAGVQASVAPQLAQAQAGIGEVASAVPATGLTNPTMISDYTTNILSKTQPYVDASNAANTAFQNAGPLGRLQTMGSGISNLTSGAGRDAFMTQIGGGKGLMQTGLAAAAPMLMETTTKQPEIKTDKDMGQRYKFNAGTQTPTPVADVYGYGNQGRDFGKEQRYFRPTYTPIENEEAKRILGFASGGPVEDMSNGNDMAAYMGRDKFAGGGSINLQGTFDMGGGQGGGQMGGSNSPQPFVGNNNAPSMVPAVMPQQGFTPMPGPAGEREGMPGGIQGLLKNVSMFAEGGAVDSYTYDPTTQLYVKKSGEGATVASPTGGASRVSGEGTTGISSNPDWENMTPTEHAEFYQDPANSLFAGITQLGQKGIANTTLGLALNALVPGFQNMHAEIAKGHTPQQTFRGSELNNQAAVEAAALQSISDQSNAGTNPSSNSPAGGFGEGQYAQGGLAALAQGGMSNLGDYSDGGRLLRGPGDGISDSIPAMIGKKQPARLADGEFVVPARIVSELGNGSTEAGARKLYAMMDRVQKARGRTVGKGKVAANSRSSKYLPA